MSFSLFLQGIFFKGYNMIIDTLFNPIGSIRSRDLSFLENFANRHLTMQYQKFQEELEQRDRIDNLVLELIERARVEPSYTVNNHEEIVRPLVRSPENLYLRGLRSSESSEEESPLVTGLNLQDSNIHNDS